MENDAVDDQIVSENLRDDFTARMESRSFAVLQGIEEADHTNVEMVEVEMEDFNVNEALRAEANCTNEILIVTTTEDIADANEVLIVTTTEDIADANEVVIETAPEDIVCVNEVVIGTAPEDIVCANEEVISAMGNEVINGSEEAVGTLADEITSEDELEASVSRQETKSSGNKEPCVKMKHFLPEDKYYFMEDLVRAVKEIRNEEEIPSPERKRRKKDHPSRRGFFFSSMHKYYLHKFISSKAEDFVSLIKESTPTDNICVFEICKERFREKYWPKTFSEYAFVNFCGAIAYLGIHCSTTGLDPSAESKAFNFICSLFYHIVKRVEPANWFRQKCESNSQHE